MNLKNIVKPLLLVLSFLVISACGSSTSTPLPLLPTYDTVSTATYKVVYIPVSDSVEGKTTYKLKLTNKTTGLPVAGKVITLNPMMDMIASMDHSTPFEALIDNGDGSYSGTIYYVMASVAADGSPMGTWNLAFTVDGETATFHPAVAMGMGRVAKLKGITDKITSMTLNVPQARTYQIFNDGIAGSSAKLYITASDEKMMMTFPAVYVGATLHDETSANVFVATMLVEVSADKTVWTPLTDGGNGHWSGALPSAIATGSHLYVRLTVNGEQKTTNSFAVGTSDALGTPMAAGTTNEYGDLTVSGM
ncbi:MAG: hypothetical protein PHN84_15775 [Desulfuromonadaceae bacterium]|nr:hypothetical protein [Desulfuromonadaceae bacterium]MDD2856324.1 hypothetical protein [Desulfuromonadaceae bacterium]